MVSVNKFNCLVRRKENESRVLVIFMVVVASIWSKLD